MGRRTMTIRGATATADSAISMRSTGIGRRRSMATYIMFGKYSPEALGAINSKRTDEAMKVIKQQGGEFKSGYALLGGVDLVMTVDLPDDKQAMKTSAALAKLLGISFSTSPAVTLEDFDMLMG
jgi:uncharacterized protein with GYD domain